MSRLGLWAVPLDERGERAVDPTLHGVSQVGSQPGCGDDGVDRAHAAGPFYAVPAVELVGDLAISISVQDRARSHGTGPSLASGTPNCSREAGHDQPG